MYSRMRSDEYGLSKEAYCFIGGIMKHMKALTFITNPSVNSYKRLIPGFEAPVYIAWSAKNRTPLIRIPGTEGSIQESNFVTRIRRLTHILHWRYAWQPDWTESRKERCRRRQ